MMRGDGDAVPYPGYRVYQGACENQTGPTRTTAVFIKTDITPVNQCFTFSSAHTVRLEIDRQFLLVFVQSFGLRPGKGATA